MPRLRFGPFDLDPATGALRRDGAPVPLTAQPTRALLALVKHTGQVVSRESLRATLWGDRAVEADTGLNFCIHQVRAALGDDARNPIYIETVPGLGYRFLAPVTSAGARSRLPLLLGGLAAALAVAVLLGGRKDASPTIRGIELEIVRADRIPDAALRQVRATLDSAVAPWANPDVAPSHRMLVRATWSDSLGGVEWRFQLVEWGRDLVLAEGALRASGGEPGAELGHLGEGVRGIITAWLSREGPPVRQFRLADKGAPPAAAGPANSP